MNRPTQTQTERSLRLAVYACVGASVLLVLGLSYTRAGEWLENGTYDVRARWTAQRTKADPRVVIIDIDNASFSRTAGKTRPLAMASHGVDRSNPLCQPRPAKRNRRDRKS